jgi:hypothetical protein
MRPICMTHPFDWAGGADDRKCNDNSNYIRLGRARDNFLGDRTGRRAAASGLGRRVRSRTRRYRPMTRCSRSSTAPSVAEPRSPRPDGPGNQLLRSRPQKPARRHAGRVTGRGNASGCRHQGDAVMPIDQALCGVASSSSPSGHLVLLSCSSRPMLRAATWRALTIRGRSLLRDGTTSPSAATTLGPLRIGTATEQLPRLISSTVVA